MTLQQIGHALDELASILYQRGNPDADDAVALRLAELQITLCALTTTRQRNLQAGTEIVGLTLIELGSQIAWLAHDVLDYYALPLERPGTNEPPLGTAGDQRLRSLFLDGLRSDETEVMRLKDDLAHFLERAP